MGNIIDGRLLAKSYRQNIKQFVDMKKELGLRVPCLATILVGNDGGSLSYVKNQNKVCDEVGVIHKNIFLGDTVSEQELIQIIDNLNTDTSVDGIMLQIPLPEGINEKYVTSKISYRKDVDGLTDINTGKFYKGEEAFIPCTPQSIISMIKSTGCDIKGKNAVVLGRSNIVGKPAAQLLLNENATVTICHSKTKSIKDICKNADILVSAIGKPGFVDGSFIKEGTVVIDVGTTMVNGKITGDVALDDVISKASYVTPVPGGVGSMTTTILIKNTCEAYKKNVY